MLESTNWLTVFPPATAKEGLFLDQLAQSLGNLPDTQTVVLAVDEALRTGQWQGRKLRNEERSLLQKVWQHLEMGIGLGLDEVVNIRNRTAFERKKPAKPEGMIFSDFDFITGDYRGKLAIEDSFDSTSLQEAEQVRAPEYVPHAEMGDVVHFLTQRIDQLFVEVGLG